MPYNSSSFEKQLAKYKQDQASKAVADMPRKKYESYADPHQVKAHVNAERGSIKSYAKDPVTQIGDEPAAKAEPIIPLIVKSRKKPLYKRTWFILFVVTTLPVLAAPILYKEEIAQLKGVATQLKTSTGVDPFALKTYTGMIKDRASGTPSTDAPMMLPSGATTDQAATTEHTEPAEMGDAVERAQAKAEAVTAKGTGYSMQYIEDEAKRLNDMAKKFDEQYKK